MKAGKYVEFASSLNDLIECAGYFIPENYLRGKPSKSNKNIREFRIRPAPDAIERSGLIQILSTLHLYKFHRFHELSPNSSKFPSIEISYRGEIFDLVISNGMNNGEKFEEDTISGIYEYLKNSVDLGQYEDLFTQLELANHEFKPKEIIDVKKNTRSTRKSMIHLEDLGDVIADFHLHSDNTSWPISLKHTNGTTFSTWPNACTLFNDYTFDENSKCAKFLTSFGVDLTKVRDGFYRRWGISRPHDDFGEASYDPSEVKKIFSRAWGKNYFYVRRYINDWDVKWLCDDKLNDLTSKIKIDEIRYPGEERKSISIYCSNENVKYRVEIRNTKSGELPNDIKFSVRS